MPISGFHVTYELITEDGEAAEGGFMEPTVIHGIDHKIPINEYLELPQEIRDIRFSMCLREAIELFREPGGEIVPSASWVEGVRWLTCYDDGGNNFETDERENRSLHFPENMSNKNIGRICKLLGVKFS